MTDQVEREQITTSGRESYTSRYGGTLWVECRGTELSSYLIITSQISPRLPSRVRVRLDKGAPFEPEGWNLVEDRGRAMFHFQGRTRDELLAWLDSTNVMTVGVYGQDSWAGERKLVFPLKTRGFRRAARKLSCFT